MPVSKGNKFIVKYSNYNSKKFKIKDKSCMQNDLTKFSISHPLGSKYLHREPSFISSVNKGPTRKVKVENL